MTPIDLAKISSLINIKKRKRGRRKERVMKGGRLTERKKEIGERKKEAGERKK